MLELLAIDVRLAGENRWRVGVAPGEAFQEITTTAIESDFAGQDVVFACVWRDGTPSHFRLLLPADAPVRELYLADKVVEELYGPAPGSSGWLEWLQRTGRDAAGTSAENLIVPSEER